MKEAISKPRGSRGNEAQSKRISEPPHVGCYGSQKKQSWVRPMPEPWIWLWVSLMAIFACSNQNAWCQSAGATRFSAQPTSAEISNTRIFDEPLIPLGGEPAVDENLALADALTVYASRTNFDDFTSLTSFLDRFPDS